MSRKICLIRPLIGASLFEASVMRVDRNEFAKPVIVTSNTHRLAKNSSEIVDVLVLFCKPAAKNMHRRCFALSCDSHFGDALLLVMPSDHHIPTVPS